MCEYFRKYLKKEQYGNHQYFPLFSSNIKFKTLFKNSILDSMKKRGWKECEDDTNWDIMWAEKEWIHDVMDQIHLGHHQKVNHFRNHFEVIYQPKLTRKDLMIKNLKRYKKLLEKEGRTDEAALLNFFPQTYNLPAEYSIFFEEFKKNQFSPNNYWIMKPIQKSQGKGIFIINKIQQISQWKNNVKYTADNPQGAEPYVVQKYLVNPLILGGKKFDMRVYCLVTSYQPLVAYLYRTGFARFTTCRYDLDDINNQFVHLTNVAIQKTAENYDERSGGKWEVQTLKHYLMGRFGADKVNECFLEIQNILIRTLLSVQKVLINDKHCFELYGFDVLLDKDIKPWLLEINASPSMTGNTPHDIELKMNLLDDVFTILDLEKVLSGNEDQIGGFDVLYKGGPVKLSHNPANISLFGASNNRDGQLKKLAKSTAIRLEKQLIEQQNIQNKLQIQKQKAKEKEKEKPTGKPVERKLVKRQNTTKINNNITLAQTTAITQSVINNVTNISKKLKQTPHDQNDENNE